MAESNRGGDARRRNEWWRGLSPEELARERQLLLNQARAGSRPAHEALLTSLLPMIHALFIEGMSREMKRETPPEDMMNTAAAQAWAGFGKFDCCHIGQYQQWVMTICRNLLSSLLRRFGEGGPQDLSRKQPLDEKAVDDSRHAYGRRPPSPDEIVAALEAGAQLETALEALPPDERQIVRWRHFDDVTFAEIASRLGRSRRWVERAFRNALATLKRRLASGGR